ncbi:7498_t:CDS:2 [Paraglomus brasilianum]|uniref:non-specific serine/threonine protein kinase n=1 Tax=Paraglomus brasilianum TaxID=144538 RepID=A0A9N8YWW0_9GLOM|nr:7498_t:CDS:2 [Paraglomus brasilianum]
MSSTETTLSTKSPTVTMSRENKYLQDHLLKDLPPTPTEANNSPKVFVTQNKYYEDRTLHGNTDIMGLNGSISRDNEPQSRTNNSLIVDNINRAGSDANEGIQRAKHNGPTYNVPVDEEFKQGHYCVMNTDTIMGRETAKQQSQQLSSSPAEPQPPSQLLRRNTASIANPLPGAVVFADDLPETRDHNGKFKPKKVLGSYVLTKTLGAGSMGKVKLAVREHTGEKLAVKIIPRTQPGDKDNKENDSSSKDDNKETRTIREAAIMLLLHHPYIVQLKEVMVSPHHYYMFFEYVNGGQMLDYIISHGKLKEKQARKFARQIVSALDYCHRNSIVHRDLKIENILISKSGSIKIIDFGLSNLYSPRSQLSTFCGSLYFAAPELLNAKVYTGPEVDVWSFGIVLFVLVCGRVPFDDQSMPALHAKIKRGVVEYPPGLSSECKHLLSRMLVTDPMKRAHLSEVMNHQWMNKGCDGPPENYLPQRMPLTMPLDMDVIRGMVGFEFGTEQEIKNKLEAIIRSDSYQSSIKAQFYRHTSASEEVKRRSLGFGSNKPFGFGSSDRLITADPTQAVHPLISIYYLVREKMERERLKSQGNSAKFGSSSSLEIPSIYASSILPPDPSHTNNNSYETNMRDPNMPQLHPSSSVVRRATVPSGTRPRSRTNGETELNAIITTPPVVDEKRIPEELLDETTGELSYGRKSSEQSTVQSTTGGLMRRLSLAVIGYTRDTLSPPHSPTMASSPGKNMGEHRRHGSTPMGPKKEASGHFSNRISNMLSRATSVSEADYKRHRQRHSVSNQRTGVSTKINSTKAPVGQLPQVIEPTPFASPSDKPANATSNRSSHQRSTSSSGTQMLKKFASGGPTEPSRPEIDFTFPPSSSTHSSLPDGTADSYIRPVFLKGLFSVATTSTKPPSVIRLDLIRVLDRIGVKWREGRGGFECVHIPSIDLKTAIGSNQAHGGRNGQSSAANNYVHYSRHDRRGSHPSNAPGQASYKDSYAQGQNLHFSPDGEVRLALPSRQGNEEANSGSGGATANVTELVVRFEIFIVKVPLLLGVHGLQFRRVAGDPWQYKNMCSKILGELKL